MKFYVYGKDNDAQEMLANVQRFVAQADLPASVYTFGCDQRQEDHNFSLTPALFLDDHLLIEGDEPGYDELGVLISVASQLYGYNAKSSGGCSSGSCGCGSANEGNNDPKDGSCSCGCGSDNKEEGCGCGGRCGCQDLEEDERSCGCGSNGGCCSN